MQKARPPPCCSSSPCDVSQVSPLPSRCCFPCSFQLTLTSPTLARSRSTLPYISPPLGNLRGNPFQAGKIILGGCSSRLATGIGSDGRSAPDGWDPLAPGAAGLLPWQWQDIAFLQPPRSHKASHRLQLCFALGCAVHTKRSWLSSVPSWEPTLERVGKKQQELELSASFPRLENSMSLRPPAPPLPPDAHAPIPPASYFL